MELLYPCACSRKSLSRHQEKNPGLSTYPGTCRNKGLNRQRPHALRIKTSNTPLVFDDAIQGHFQQALARDIGDFVIRRRDHAFAYQLAVVVDDHDQEISEVMRGVDLLESTPRQIFIQRCLDLSTPHYGHIPVLVDKYGKKLSKQAHARPVDDDHPSDSLFYLLERLNQSPPKDLCGAKPETLLDWAIAHWDSAKLRNVRTIPL